MNQFPTSDETEQDLPDSNTLGGAERTQTGPDGEKTAIPAPETTGIGHDDLDKADDVARRLNERTIGNE